MYHTICMATLGIVNAAQISPVVAGLDKLLICSVTLVRLDAPVGFYNVDACCRHPSRMADSHGLPFGPCVAV